MIGLRAQKTPQNPMGRPLAAIARELRLEIEAEVGRVQAEAGTTPSTELALGLQAVGLLLQLEATDKLLRALPGALDAAARATELRALDHPRHFRSPSATG